MVIYQTWKAAFLLELLKKIVKGLEELSEKMNEQNETIFFHPDLFVVPENSEAPYLIGYHCEGCGKVWFPKVEICPNCWSEKIGQNPLSKVGKLYSYSIIHVGQKGIKAPYVIGYVDMPENVRIFAQLEIDPAQLKIGMDLQVTSGIIRVDENGKPVLSYKFKPIEG